MNTKKLSDKSACDIINGVLISHDVNNRARGFTNGMLVVLVKINVDCEPIAKGIESIGFKVTVDKKEKGFYHNFIWITK